MLRGLRQLTWIEIKIFLREPMGAIGTIVMPVLAFLLLGKATAGRGVSSSSTLSTLLRPGGIPTLVSMLITISAVLSLVTIISIYREGGILKRLRATPLRPWTILSAHVLVKLLLTALTMIAMVLAGRRYFTVGPDVPIVSFTLALLISTLSILSIGFIIASIVPTARFAQPIGAFIFYPMIALSGLFAPIAAFPPVWRAIALVLPLSHSASLMQGIWVGDPWSAHIGDVAALAGAISGVRRSIRKDVSLGVMRPVYPLRVATIADVPALRLLIELSVRGLSVGFYNPAQIDAAMEHIFGVDTQLITDGTYYVIDGIDGAEGPIAAGGWSARRTLFGGDQMKSADDPALDPAQDPARIRAFFVHPDWARRGLGRQLYAECARAASAAGFRTLELMATLPGEPLYAALGFSAVERLTVSLAGHVEVPCVRMARRID